MPRKSNDAYLFDMVAAARLVQQFVDELGGDKTNFEASLAYQNAIAHQVQIIGEAAFQLSQKAKARIALPWVDIISMRHRLVHDYGDIDLDIVWDTATEDMQPLIDTLEPLISPSETDE